MIENFIADQGITFPVLRDIANVYGQYNIPGGQSPYPRDYIVDGNGVLQLAKTEYDPGTMINVIEELLNIDVGNDPELYLQVPETIYLHPNYPNPFNPTTTLQFTVPTLTQLSLDLVNLKGSVVATLFINKPFTEGDHHVLWNGLNDQGLPLPSGQYVVRLQNKNKIITRKVTLLK